MIIILIIMIIIIMLIGLIIIVLIVISRPIIMLVSRKTLVKNLNLIFSTLKVEKKIVSTEIGVLLKMDHPNIVSKNKFCSKDISFCSYHTTHDQPFKTQHQHTFIPTNSFKSYIHNYETNVPDPFQTQLSGKWMFSPFSPGRSIEDLVSVD